MAITVKHSKVSTIPDADDTSLVRPSDWNADHSLVGTVPVDNGGTGASTLTGYVKGNGTSAMTAATTIPSTDVTGLGTMSTQNSNNINVTGGSMSGVTISDYIATTQKGIANGVASLDGSGTVPVSQLPAAVLGALSYQGTWNASTNTPTLTSSVGTKGYYYVVNVAGSTNLNGITDWLVGDWAVYNGSAWQKVDNTDAVTSVNGYTGTVVLTAADVGAVPYTGATAAVDLNNKSLVNVSHLGVNTTTVPDILIRAIGDNNTSSRIAMRGYSSDANSSSMRVTKFRGTTSAPQAPQSGDSLGKFELAGYGTTSSGGYAQASLEGVATEAWGATARGAKALIKVTPNTTTTQVTALTIDQNSAATFASTVTANGVLLTGNTGTVTSVAATAGTGISISGSPITNSGTLTVTNTAPDQTVVLTAGTGISTSGTYPNFTITNTSPSSGGTVTSVTGTSPVVSSGGTTPAISMPAATTSVNGYLTSTDWNTFNSKGSGTVTSVSATAPITSSGGATPNLAMPAATTSVSGYLTSTDWNTFNGKGSGTVTSVGGTGTVNGISLSGTVTSSGNLTLGGTLDLSSPPAIGATTPNAGTFSSFTLNGTSGNFNGDFTNATVLSRNSFKTSTTNGTTGIYALPNGTSTAASWQASNAADPTNASKILIATNGSLDTQLVSGINGTGTYLPLTVYSGGQGRFVFGTSGQFGVGSASLVSYGTSGQVFTSGGGSSNPTWTTPSSTFTTALSAPSASFTAALPVTSGGTGVTTSTGTGSTVLSASPTFTGTPIAPTATSGTNTTQIATTAFAFGTLSAVSSGYQKLPSGLIIQWGTNVGTSPTTVTLPITFPNGYLGWPIVTNGDFGNSTLGCGASGTPSTSSFTLATSHPGAYRWAWIFIGY